MSTELLGAEFYRFLESDSPEVLCVSGKWGIGKTYAWNFFLENGQKNNCVALTRYSYVSLFGRNSLEDIRVAIVENTCDIAATKLRPNLQTMQSTVSWLRSKSNKFVYAAKSVPKFGGYFDATDRILFFHLEKVIVCFDDLERLGSGVELRSILGLISNLKDQKLCKIVLLLNEDAFEEDRRKTFVANLEKISDTYIKFMPTSKEAAELALNPDTMFRHHFVLNVVTLGITNIRVIKKAENLFNRLSKLLLKFDPRVSHLVIKAIIVAVYSKFQPNQAPPFDLLYSFNPKNFVLSEDSTKTVSFNQEFISTLQAYDFNGNNPLNVVILDGVDKGLFDTQLIQIEATLQQKMFELSDRDNSFQKSWDLFRDSFDHNEAYMLDMMIEAIKTSREVINPADLSATIILLKEFGRRDSALKALEVYVNELEKNADFWNLDENSYGEHVQDLDVREAFRKKYIALATPPDPVRVFLEIRRNQTWDGNELEKLSRLTTDDFVKLFKTLRGRDLDHVIQGALKVQDLADIGTNLQNITYNAQAALRQIGKESRLNAKRIAKYRITQHHVEGSSNIINTLYEFAIQSSNDQVN